MNKSAADLCMIARAGGSLRFDAGTKSTADLCMIARAMADTGGTLALFNAGNKSTADLCMIARANPGKVQFE